MSNMLTCVPTITHGYKDMHMQSVVKQQAIGLIQIKFGIFGAVSELHFWEASVFGLAMQM